MLNAVRSYGEYQVLSDFRNHPVGQVAYVEQVVVFLVEAVHLALDQQPGLRRDIGATIDRPFTRSSIKPKRLFVEEIERRNKAIQDEEEAVTDVEVDLDADLDVALACCFFSTA